MTLNNPIEQLAGKLQEDFNVIIEDSTISIEAPEVILVFDGSHSSVIMRNLTFITLKGIVFNAEATARMGHFTHSNAQITDVEIINVQPYKIKIKGQIPIIYFFVRRILHEET
jgi:hypothetical protein